VLWYPPCCASAIQEEAAMADEFDRDRENEEMGRTKEDVVSAADEDEEFDDLDDDESEEDDDEDLEA
jgi:hypothetical protein